MTKCLHCSKPFEPKRKWHRYCSSNCRVKEFNKKAKRRSPNWEAIGFKDGCQGRLEPPPQDARVADVIDYFRGHDRGIAETKSIIKRWGYDL